MKKVSIVMAALALTVGMFTGSAQAGVPFINLEGVGGVAFNPLAYPAVTAPKKGEDGLKIGPVDIGKPRIGVWYVNLNDSDIDWFTGGIAETFGNRLEVSYGYESVAVGAVGRNTHKNNVGAKVLLLEENSFGTKFIPAVSVGTIYKNTSLKTGPKVTQDGLDYYVVATKLIPELPKPVLLSAGVLSTSGQVNGILGFNEQRKQTFFGNIDILPLPNIAIGFEFKQGALFKTFKNANYFNAHVGWFVNPNLTLIAAYAHAGDTDSKTRAALSDGPVISIQYEF